MSNLAKARQALLAELRHVEKGVAYYQNLAASLRAALEQLDRSDNPLAASAPRKSANASGAKAARAGKKGQGARKASSSRSGLPKTSQEFWLGFLDGQPKTAAEIGNAAVASLGFTPTQQQAKQLKSRLAPTLQALLKAKKIQDSGTGRERKYKLAASRPSDTAKGKGKASVAAVEAASLTNGNAVHH